MSYRLLITVRTSDFTRTLSFDETVQSVLWVGLVGEVGPGRAVARFELDEGRLLLTGSNGWQITSPKCEELAVGQGEELVVGLTARLGDQTVRLHIRPVDPRMRRYRKMRLAGGAPMVIGRSRKSDLVYANHYVSSSHARLALDGRRLTITDLGSSNGTTVNGKQLAPSQPYHLKPGDVAEILDLTIAAGSDFVSINEPPGVSLDESHGLVPLTHDMVRYRMPEVEATDEELGHFYPAPRLSRSVHPLELRVDDPPVRQRRREQPVILQIGPSFLMALSSIVMAASAFSRLSEGADAFQVAPAIVMAVAMVAGSLVWPMLSRSYERKRDEAEEARRGTLYMAYLDGIENRLSGEATTQAQILEENRCPVNGLLDRAAQLSPLLMNRTSVHDDYMELRVGIGDADIEANVAWPSRGFTLEQDRLLDAVDALAARPPRLRDVPLAFNPAVNFIAGILGERAFVWSFLRGLLVQVCALYSYQDVKIVMLSDEEEMGEWSFLTHLGHLYDSAGERRLVGLTNGGLVEEDLLLEQELERRADVHAEVLSDYGTYYIVICANQRLTKRSEAIARLLELRFNAGFSLIYLGNDLADLPRECGYIIDLDQSGRNNLGISLSKTTEEKGRPIRSARMFERSDVQGTLRPFDPDIMLTRDQAEAFALNLAHAHLDVPEQRTSIPDVLGFLELYQVGSVNHLNIGQRWSASDGSRSLEVPIGLGEEGEPAVLDLHEKIHGPHGLIAGTTGSGKSEFIITYILSMCVNFSPDEVAFVLIDYKGGGLAGAFDNERHHLPHLAGTITNLDGAQIKRSLISIQSELKRRQGLFNQARDITGEATIDIYKYLSFYRQGLLTEPLPHLFIVADEFAELKQQEPEFMDELISAARIGRSLGVHLILATQKPSGVVNDQIWSNSRFKVSLKVADAADSRELLRRDDAAEITQPGRYFLLVGYNESFMEAQAAYAGGQYQASEVFEPRRDNAVELLDAEGVSIARLRPISLRMGGGDSELNAVLGQIEQTAQLMNRHANRLWLDPLPPRISLSALTERYGLPRGEDFKVLAGMLDDPENQRQDAFVVDIGTAGNVMLYGTQNSGVDELLGALLVSLAATYDARQLWLYGIDYGSGSLAMLAGLPQVGGVVLAGDGERLTNLFRMLGQEMRDRRSVLSQTAAGSLETYNKHAKTPLPRIVVALTNLATFQELNEGLQDELVSLTRDAPRYGIHFIVSAATATTPRLRLRSNFGVELPTMMNDTADYVTVFGSMVGVTPPHQERRGLVRQGKRLLEFQGLCIAEYPGDEAAVIAGLKSSTTAVARPIPVLPAQVRMQDFDHAATAARAPIGFAKQGIAPVWHPLDRSPYLLVYGNDEGEIGRFLRGLRDAYARQDLADYRIVDPQNLLGAVDDTRVLRSEEELTALVDGLYDGSLAPELLIFTSIVQTVVNLPGTSSQRLQSYLTEERGAGHTAIVAATELWRARNLYQDWYKVVTSAGNGVWVGSGFGDQTVFRFARSLPEYRLPAERSDGFYVLRGKVEAVRLLEATDEPIATDN